MRFLASGLTFDLAGPRTILNEAEMSGRCGLAIEGLLEDEVVPDEADGARPGVDLVEPMSVKRELGSRSRSRGSGRRDFVFLGGNPGRGA